MLRAAEIAGLEGIVAKRLDSPYLPGRRSTAWTKTPLAHTQEVLICGHTTGQGRRAGTIGALLLGVYDPDGQLGYVGHVGTGFSNAALHALHARLEPLRQPTPSLPDVPREYARGAVWVQPLLVGEVVYRTLTGDGRLRHASWRGLRPDRDPSAAILPGRRPTPPVPQLPEAPVVEGVMRTADGRWQVQVVSRAGRRWYRILHDDNTIDQLDLAGVEQMLARVGVRLDELTDTGAA